MGDLSRANRRARLPRIIEKANALTSDPHSQPLTATECAILLGVSHQRVLQLERRALAKLSRLLTSPTLAQVLAKCPPPESPTL